MWKPDLSQIVTAEQKLADTLADYETALQGLVDRTARERQFKDGVSLASYVASTNPKWAAEAKAFIAWRDQVWAFAYAELAKVQSGTAPVPPLDDFLSSVNRIVWPA